MNHEIHWTISEDPIPAPPEGFDPGHGAGIEFLGVVRSLEDGRPLSGIDYSCYLPMAEAEMRRLSDAWNLEQADQDATRLPRIRIHHRLGFVRVGEASLAIRVRSAHSAAAFGACRWWLDRIKQRLPIWKRPIDLESVR